MTRVRASLIIIRITIRAWASLLKKQRIHRRTTRVRRSIRLTTTIPWVPKSLTRASTRHALTTPIPTRHPKILRTSSVQLNQTPRRRTTAAISALRDDQHRKIITVDQAHVVEIQAVGAVESELGQRRRRFGPAGAFDFAGAAVGGEAGEFSGGVTVAESPGPDPTRPGLWDG